MAEEAASADSTISFLDRQIASQHQVIFKTNKLLADCDSLSNIRAVRIDIVKQDGKAWEGKYHAQEGISNGYKAEKRKWQTYFWVMVAIQAAEIILKVALHF